MEITVVIDTCNDCRHKDHSGSFTPGGAKAICGHSGACDIVGKYKKEQYHWKHRVLNEKTFSTPDWCPLKHGHFY